MHLDNALDQRQPDTSARCRRIKLLKQPEHFLLIFGVNTDPVILHVEYPLCSLLAYPDSNTWLRLVAHEFGSVVEQVLQQLD